MRLIERTVFLFYILLDDAPDRVQRRAWDLTKEVLPRVVALMPLFAQRAGVSSIVVTVGTLVHRVALSAEDKLRVRSMGDSLREQVQRGHWKACEDDPAERKRLRADLCSLSIRLLRRAETTDATPEMAERVSKVWKDTLAEDGKCEECGAPCVGNYCACKSVQYCDRRCQMKHRPQHRQACKIRIDMLGEYGDQKYELHRCD